MCVCVCQREKEECESPRVSYSSANVSFPFFTSHLPTLLFLGHVSRTAACSYTSVHITTRKSHRESSERARGNVHLL